MNKRINKNLMNKCSILNGAKSFSLELKNTVNIAVVLLGLILGNIMECQKNFFENIAKSNHYAPTS